MSFIIIVFITYSNIYEAYIASYVLELNTLFKALPNIVTLVLHQLDFCEENAAYPLLFFSVMEFSDSEALKKNILN